MSEGNIVPVKSEIYRISPVTPNSESYGKYNSDANKELEENPDSVFAFLNLSRRVSSKEEKRKLIFKALYLDSECGRAYYEIASTMEISESLIVPGGKCFTKPQCLVRAIELDPNYAYAYIDLAIAIFWRFKEIIVLGKAMSPHELANMAYRLGRFNVAIMVKIEKFLIMADGVVTNAREDLLEGSCDLLKGSYDFSAVSAATIGREIADMKARHATFVEMRKERDRQKERSTLGAPIQVDDDEDDEKSAKKVKIDLEEDEKK